MVRNVPQKSGRARGRELASRGRLGSRSPSRSTTAPVNRAAQFVYKPTQGSAPGRLSRLASPNTLGRNRSNAQRKPTARRTSPFKQMMRKQPITPQVAEAMRDEPQKGDRRRSEAERKVRRRAMRQVRAVRRGRR